ncbi:alkaline phosphatase family protein [Microlunatus sp. Gsoil 973]|uniref:alkaline phosphatase family protein n=1 Tax=Microlunatus sp. Gsoil 973 TaxID=2672569 RepID=UPI0012B4A7FE|nr:alkaline phosphatase family protein [Microlunatus sp. Gsoil 973]QGN34108.1 phosphoesterase [Microlunatus sp. Gsoil 973]
MHVKRQRRQATGSRFSWRGRPVRIALAGLATMAVTGGGLAYATSAVFGTNQVGTTYRSGIQVSDDQIIKPLGDRLETPYGKFMSSTVSPDGRFLAATSTDRSVVLQIFDLQTYRLIWTVGSASTVDQKLSDGSVGQEGPTYSPNGRYLWLPETNGLTRFAVNDDGTLGAATKITIPTVDGHSALVGAAAYSPDGTTLYAAVNGQNTVAALDPSTGTIKQTWDVGIAPRGLQFVGNRLYVSNEGGRQSKPGETTMTSYGSDVPSDPVKGTSTTGTVSVIDTAHPSATIRSIAVGLHPTAMYLAGNALFVANTFDDSISVIDTNTDNVVQTISSKPWASSTVGYAPTSITLSRDNHLLVTLGRANAVAVYKYHGDPREPVNYLGLLPTDYYPSQIATVGNQIVVTNTRGIDARGPELTYNEGAGTVPATGHGTHSTTASLTRFVLPSDQRIAGYTSQVFAQNGWSGSDVKRAAHGKAKPVPVPARIGDPSTIKHVFLIVKENRSYDQVFGDMPEGNGDPQLAQFGAKVTPNEHALARQFGLYDNFYDVGTNSAEGHNWMMQGDNPEYTESSAGEYIRSYDTEEDVLGHQRSGFLWTAVQAAGGTARNYGEFEYTEGKPAGSTWQQYYCAATSVAKGGDPAQLTTPELKGDYGSVIPSLNAIADHASPPFDTSIPDVYRARLWKQDFEKNGPANLNMFWLSSDHTGGTADPEAQNADNDLAVGQIVDEISHSRYWKDSAIFVVEDDSQNGADHVDGHRAPIQVISPWAQHGKVINTFYSQITLVRTIEQILGAQPLNQKVAAATPMYGAFTGRPDYRPYDAVSNQVPLTEGVVTEPSCGWDTLGKTGAAAKELNAAVAKKTAISASQLSTATKWEKWTQSQHLIGNGAVPDYAHPEQLNRYIWYQTHQWKVPYPGDSRIYAPVDVPGANIPGVDGDH